MLRSNAIVQLMSKLPDGIIEGSMTVTGYEERGDEVVVKFESGQEVVADLLVAADGIHSKISEQAFGDPGIFYIGIRAFLAWCEDFGGIDRDFVVIHHVEFVRKLGDQFHKAPAPVA